MCFYSGGELMINHCTALIQRALPHIQKKFPFQKRFTRGLPMLTSKKRLFAEALLTGKSQTDSAKSAGYSAKTAKQAGYKLANDKEIQEYINRKQHNVALYNSESEEKVKEITVSKQHYSDPIEFLNDLMNNEDEDPKLRLEAAKAMMPYLHAKIGEQGKKENKIDKANNVARGKFAPSSPPKLQAVK